MVNKTEKPMKNRLFLLLLSVSAGLAACAELEPDTPSIPEEPGLEAGQTGMTILPVAFADEPDVRSVMDVTDTGLTFSWENTDAVGVYSQSGGFARFGLSSGAGDAVAVFDGKGFDLTPGSLYHAFYPYVLSATEPTAVAISFAGQSATADNDLVSVMSRDYLASSAEADATGRASFTFSHLGSFLRMKLSLPAGAPIDGVELIPLHEPVPVGMNVNLVSGALAETTWAPSLAVSTEGLSAPAEGPFTLWAAMPAKDYADDDFAVLVHSGETLYSARHSGSAFLPGKAYRWKVTPVVDASVPDYGFTKVEEGTAYNPSTDAVPSGQYSGIAWVGGTRYAVVHDKYNGGGIVFFDIDISEDGAVHDVTSSIPLGTTDSGTCRDCEGVAFVPGAPGTLFVSAESDQLILEYALDGYPTGRRLITPIDMEPDAITGNAGFEALTYNATSGLFWTVTEAPLVRDASLGRVLRLQSFTSSLDAGDRFLYRTDEPTKTDAEAAAARSYVFGVPALAALDDGRVLVLEREVYVPNGNPIQMYTNSFTRMNIYAVNPASDTAGILRKTLVASFSTTAADLANYEGMCIGPTLPDGSTCLVLIPDSQGGSSGLTREYVKVITLK